MVDRALSLLAAFDAVHRSLTLGELSRRSGIPTSSTLRLANRLLAWGALERGDDGRFTVGLRLWEIASLAPRGHGLRQVAIPFMGSLGPVPDLLLAAAATTAACTSPTRTLARIARIGLAAGLIGVIAPGLYLLLFRRAEPFSVFFDPSARSGTSPTSPRSWPRRSAACSCSTASRPAVTSPRRSPTRPAGSPGR
ncbi:helix-turn-helix domain-containing protein [Pseudonocardia nigra]|uniref:helix-turn-helix domain-containing protein n=1 Tax=Pseudonocardia nigra TaxID=1921578 RepID=UPI0027E2F2F5|nr:helix-turn-helix domain-containing protein [Pseudonocardia nigra]